MKIDNAELLKFNSLSFEDKLKELYRIQLEIKAQKLIYPAWLTNKKFTIIDVAKFCNVSRSTIYNKIIAGLIPSEYDTKTKKYFIAWSDILNFKNELQNKAS